MSLEVRDFLQINRELSIWQNKTTQKDNTGMPT